MNFLGLNYNTILKIIALVMSLHFINISIDAPDLTPSYLPEDLTINDQESILEVFVEKILGFENAIEENDDDDSSDNKGSKKIDLQFYKQSDSRFTTLANSLNRPNAFYLGLLHSGYYSYCPPPPKI